MKKIIIILIITFTLIAGLKIITLISRSNLSANETNVFNNIEKLRRNFELFRISSYLDNNKNGKGEYGFFNDLAKKNLLPKNYIIKNSSIIKAYGFYYKIYLPLKINKKEMFYILYVWPDKYGTTGACVMFVDQKNIRLTRILVRSGFLETPSVDLAYIKKNKHFEFGITSYDESGIWHCKSK